MDKWETRIPPVVLTALGAAIVWLIARVDREWKFLFTGTAELVAIALALIGVGILFDALGGFTRVKTTVNPHKPSSTTAIVTKGMYRFSRNPMYLGLVLLVAAFAFWLSSLIGLIVGPLLLAAVLTRLQIIPEERMLSEKFGAEYDAYRDRVRRWI